MFEWTCRMATWRSNFQFSISLFLLIFHESRWCSEECRTRPTRIVHGSQAAGPGRTGNQVGSSGTGAAGGLRPLERRTRAHAGPSACHVKLEDADQPWQRHGRTWRGKGSRRAPRVLCSNRTRASDAPRRCWPRDGAQDLNQTGFRPASAQACRQVGSCSGEEAVADSVPVNISTVHKNARWAEACNAAARIRPEGEPRGNGELGRPSRIRAS